MGGFYASANNVHFGEYTLYRGKRSKELHHGSLAGLVSGTFGRMRNLPGIWFSAFPEACRFMERYTHVFLYYNIRNISDHHLRNNQYH
jgi:hypothetical protein